MVKDLGFAMQFNAETPNIADVDDIVCKIQYISVSEFVF